MRLRGAGRPGWPGWPADRGDDDGLHRPLTAGPDDEDDWRVCATCGADLMSLFMCDLAPTEVCGCPTYAVRDGEHFEHD